MKSVGVVLWLLGLAVFSFAAFAIDTTVESAGELFGVSRTHNIGLQQNQLITVLAGLTLFLAGTIVHALGVVADLTMSITPRAEAPSLDETAGSVSAFSSQADIAKKTDEYWETEAARLGITKSDEKFVFGPYRYDSLTDAIRYARDHQEERS
jgi:hypothetical protein